MFAYLETFSDEVVHDELVEGLTGYLYLAHLLHPAPKVVLIARLSRIDLIKSNHK